MSRKKPKTYKILYNACYGGFSLSKEAVLALRKAFPDDPRFQAGNQDSTLTEESWDDGTVNRSNYDAYLRDIPRHDQKIIEVLEELGLEKASGECAKLAIEEITDESYQIEEYDGSESVATYSQPQDWISVLD